MPRPRAAVDEELPDGDPASVLRRAPFSDNPRVGARGQRAQQRILAAALQVFGEVGYHQTGIIGITEVAGCSRAAFYQYFSSKEDVFRHLAGHVARQLIVSAEALDPVTPDQAGWDSLRAWIERHAEIYERYEPVFLAFQAAAESDDAVASGAARIGERTIASVRSKISGSTLPSRHVGGVIGLLQEVKTRSPRVAHVLRALGTDVLPEARVQTALTDVAHRTLFGLDPAVNVHPPAKRPTRSPAVRFELDAVPPSDGDLSPTGVRTLQGLLDAAHEVLVARGYHATRVDDIANAAGVSHGAFYRYFENKDHVVRVLAARSLGRVSTAFAEIPDAAEPAALRRWLRRYVRTHTSETAMIRVWVDATEDSPGLSRESAAALEWGRRRMVRFLRPRGFGDVDTEALVMVVLLDAFGAQPRPASGIEAAALVIERGLLGR